MPTPFEPQWISTAVEAPLMAALAWMLHGLRRGLSALPDASCADPGVLERTRDDLSAFKLEVARTYVPLSLIRDVDQRLTQHLLRIEHKLDEATRSATIAAARIEAMQEDRG